MSSWQPYVLVASGGALGALARFVLSRWVGLLVETRFPLGTFVINVSGCFLLGLLGALVTDRVVPNGDSLRLALGIGFLGAFTTFSTFELETHALLEDGSWVTASANMFLSLFLGLLAVRAGIVAAKSWLG
jgi:CrcB protein